MQRYISKKLVVDEDFKTGFDCFVYASYQKRTILNKRSGKTN